MLTPPLLTAISQGETPVLGPSPVLPWGWPGLAGGRCSCPEALARLARRESTDSTEGIFWG